MEGALLILPIVFLGIPLVVRSWPLVVGPGVFVSLGDYHWKQLMLIISYAQIIFRHLLQNFQIEKGCCFAIYMFWSRLWRCVRGENTTVLCTRLIFLHMAVLLTSLHKPKGPLICSGYAYVVILMETLKNISWRRNSVLHCV